MYKKFIVNYEIIFSGQVIKAYLEIKFSYRCLIKIVKSVGNANDESSINIFDSPNSSFTI
jgi:hypothetical protein